MMIKKLIQNVRINKPLVHNITNYVTVNDCANITLACGASPIMADDEAEVEEITSICDGVVINMGTLNQRTIKAMHLAGKKANQLDKPITIDPVGVGASKLRTKTAYSLINEVNFSVIRGNISEIKSIYTGIGFSQGVDASIEDSVTDHNIESTISFAKELAKQTGAVIAISGAIDLIVDDKSAYIIRNGTETMSQVTGCGCMLTSLIGAYTAANKENILEACAAAFLHLGISGEYAFEKIKSTGEGTGSFRTYLIDYVNILSAEDIEERAKISDTIIKSDIWLGGME